MENSLFSQMQKYVAFRALSATKNTFITGYLPLAAFETSRKNTAGRCSEE